MEEHVLIPTHRPLTLRFFVQLGIAALVTTLSACSTTPTASTSAQAPVSIATPDVKAQAPDLVDADKTKSSATETPDPIASLAAGQPIDDLRPDVNVNLDD